MPASLRGFGRKTRSFFGVYESAMANEVALGAVLWLVNRLVEGPHDEVEAERLRG